MVTKEANPIMKLGSAVTCACILLAAMTWTVARAQGADFTKLSGTWAGTRTVHQKGQCSVGGPGRKHDSSPIRFTLDVAADGSFTMIDEPPGPNPQLGLGRFESDLSFTLAMPARAVCREVPREYSIDFMGKVKVEKGRAQLKMEGLDLICPDMECRFLMMISAKQR